MSEIIRHLSVHLLRVKKAAPPSFVKLSSLRPGSPYHSDYPAMRSPARSTTFRSSLR